MPLICSSCQQSFPMYRIIDGKKHNLCNRKYCLECSPFGQHNTRTLHVPPKKGKQSSICIECGNEHHAKVKRKYCSVTCQMNYQWKNITVPNILIGKGKCSVSLKRYLAEIRGYECSRCHISEWDGEKIVLQLDHIDGNSDDNSLKNLRLMCPNCHSLTPTYKGGNKGNLKDTKRNRLHRHIYARTTEPSIDRSQSLLKRL